jgi:hypothetical protein
MTEDQKFCKLVLAHWAGGEHHLPTVHLFGAGICINVSNDLATFDFDRLTRLVITAHRWAVRIEIASSGPRLIKIIAHRRSPVQTESIYRRHPDLCALKLEAAKAELWEL